MLGRIPLTLTYRLARLRRATAWFDRLTMTRFGVGHCAYDANMRPPIGAIVLCLLGLALAIVAWFAGDAAVVQKRAQVRRGWALKPTVVTSVDVPAGAALTLTQLELRDVPDQLRTESLLDDPHTLVGRIASVALPKGTPVYGA